MFCYNQNLPPALHGMILWGCVMTDGACLELFVLDIGVGTILGEFHNNFPRLACWGYLILRTLKFNFALFQNIMEKNASQGCYATPI